MRKFAHRIRDCLAPSSNDHTHRLKKQIYYTCGRNAQEIGDALAQAIKQVTASMDFDDHLVFIEDDESRFDLHLTEGPFRLLDYLYSKFLPRKVRQLLRRTRNSRGVTHLGTKYSVPFTMQSGWPDTSVGDTLVNAAMKGDIHGWGRNWVSIICGDDSVTVTTAKELERLGGAEGLKRSYTNFGMEVEILVRESVADVEFCSARFYPTQHTFIMMPKPGKILSKICWDMEVRGKANRIVWLRSVACTLDLYGKVDPCIAALARVLHDYTGAGKLSLIHI